MLPEHELFVEAPASFPAESEEVHEVTLRSGTKVLLLSPEDVDIGRLDARASEEGLTPTLAAVRGLEERVERGETIETWELHEIAKRLERER